MKAAGRASLAVILLAAVVAGTSIRVAAAQMRAGGYRAFWTNRFQVSLSRYEWLSRLVPGSLEARDGELGVHIAALERFAGSGGDSRAEYRQAARRGGNVLRGVVEAAPLRPETWAGVANYFAALKVENQHHRTYTLEKISARPEENLEPEDIAQIRALERATVLDPNGFYYRDVLGDLCWNAGLRSLALGNYAEAVTLEPEPGEHPFLSAVNLDPELEETAERAMERSVEPPRNADPERVYRNLGFHLLDRERFEQARKAFERAQAAGTGNYFPLLAYAAARSGQTEDAIRLYRQSIASSQFNPDERFGDHLRLGDLLESVGKHEDAAREIRAALSLKPGDPQALLLLGRIDETMGQLSEAEQMYRRAAETSTEPITALVNLVEFYRRTGRPAEALVPAQKLVTLQPDEDVYRKLVQQITSEVDKSRAR